VTDAMRVVARMTLLRLGRGRTMFVSVCLALLPIATAALLAAKQGNDEARNLQRVLEVALRFVATLTAVLHLAPSVSEEVDGKTWTYLWSRPFPRQALVLGKLLAIAPAVMALTTVSVGMSYLILFEGSAAAHVPALLQGLYGAYGATLGAGAFAIAIGSLFPRYPLVFSLGWFAAEQIMFLVPNVAKLSPLYHARFLAGLEASRSEPESLLAAFVWLAALTAGLLGVAIWRVRKAEYARADG
jgi:ABC-type transport system involved in multi-copper enzyme maturation permease subunit